MFYSTLVFFSWYLRPSDTLLQIPLCNQGINIYFKPLQKTSFMVEYLHHFLNAWSKQVLWKFYSKPKTLQLTTIFSIIVIVFKLDPSPFTYPKNSFFEFYFSNNQVKFLAKVCLIISMTSKSPRVICLVVN